MTTQDGSPPRSPRYPESDNPLVVPRIRNPAKASKPPASDSTLSFRPSSASLSTLFASTLGTSTPKRASTSVAGTPPATEIPDSVFFPINHTETPDELNVYRGLIVRSFAPHVAVLASADTEELLAGKGFLGGLLELVRPYGEHVPGKVTIRDSSGSSRSYGDFAVRFTKLKDGLESPRSTGQRSAERRSTDSQSRDINGYVDQYSPYSAARLRTGGDVLLIDQVAEKHLSFFEMHSDQDSDEVISEEDRAEDASPFASPFHLLYLRRLLSGLPMTPHETFSHPVACVITVSSRNSDPIEELRNLHATTNTGDQRLPQWVNNEYLRYYVLVHDEEHDDLQRSTLLFDQMKRHFGLHCHLLRLRSTQCIASDDDSRTIPNCDWMSAAEELSEIRRRENLEEVENTNRYLFESDETAVKNFVREMVTQSLVPMMERLCTTWNDQVVSRRRGISGRFLSLSKKWTPFGTSRNASSTVGGGSLSGGNYDTLQGFYRPDSPEAIMRKLADYAFMLRDFKLAQSTYDMLRADFSNDKAWKYYAGANEMAAITSLLSISALNAKSRTDGVDQMLETACYSYLTRCAAPFNALRTLAVSLELLKLRGGSATDDAARWASRILELGLVGPTGHALFTERTAACFASRTVTGSRGWGSRRRKAALWSVLATESWLSLEKTRQAEKCLKQVFQLYQISSRDPSLLAFDDMKSFLLDLREAVAAKRGSESAFESLATSQHQVVEDEPVMVEKQKPEIRSHRKSIIGMSPAPTISLQPGLSDHEEAEQEGFG